MRYNQECFSKEQVEAKSHLKLLSLLFELDMMDQDGYHDIHVWNDGETLVVEWFYKFYDSDISPEKFMFVDTDEAVVKEVYLPDGTTAFAANDKEAEELKNNWLESHSKSEDED